MSKATVEAVKELIKKHEEFDKRMNTNDDKINQMMQFADRLNDENHYASDKITEKARSIDERQGNNFYVVLFYKNVFFMSPVDLRAGPVTRTNFTLGSYEKFQPGFRDEERPKILGMSSGVKFEKRSKRGETQSYNLRACYSFGNSYSCITAVKWDAYDVVIQQAKQDDVIRPALLPCCFLPGDPGEVFIWQNFPARDLVRKTEISGTKPARPLI